MSTISLAECLCYRTKSLVLLGSLSGACRTGYLATARAERTYMQPTPGYTYVLIGFLAREKVDEVISSVGGRYKLSALHRTLPQASTHRSWTNTRYSLAHLVSLISNTPATTMQNTMDDSLQPLGFSWPGGGG